MLKSWRLIALTALTLAALTSAEPASAQQRVIPLPDTVGANFAIADSATVAGTPADYDAFLGEWHFTFQSRRNDGTYGPPFTGHWTFHKVPGPRSLIIDHWRRDDPTTSGESGTRTFRVFNQERQRWEVHGTSSNATGSWQPGVGWSDAGHRYLIQRLGPTMIMRFKYLAIQENRFLWRADMSSDNGTTWINDWWIMEVTRISR